MTNFPLWNLADAVVFCSSGMDRHFFGCGFDHYTDPYAEEWYGLGPNSSIHGDAYGLGLGYFESNGSAYSYVNGLGKCIGSGSTLVAEY